MTRRRGAGLAELLVTLALSGVVMATASRGLVQHVRQSRDREAQAQADGIVRDVQEVIRGELGHADVDPRLRGDTALDLASLRTVALACEASAARLVLPAASGWWSPPKVGDSVAVLDTLTGAEWRSAVVATGTQRASVACPAGGTRLTLAAAPPASVPTGLLPVRIWRLARYMAYRAGDGTWWLGERACLPECGTAQPVAGPLLPPSQGGFRLALVLAGDGRPAALDLTVRAVVRGRAARLSARIPLASVP